jgi:hypothetical protein
MQISRVNKRREFQQEDMKGMNDMKKEDGFLSGGPGYLLPGRAKRAGSEVKNQLPVACGHPGNGVARATD